MKKYISLFLLCLWALCLQAQQGSIDPENPGDPSPFYTLRINVSPASGGTPNFTKKMVTAGDRVYIDIELNKNFKLLQWVYGDSILTTNEAFYFTMPANDVVLTAQLLHSTVFDPESPDDPASPNMNRKHLVTIFATPSTAGEVYPSSFYLKQGEQKTVYAYPYSGYEFMGWYVNDELQSDNNPLVITMKDQDLAITAKFQFNPTSPNDPGANFYDPTTGEVIIDRFQPGNLYSAMYSLLGDWWEAEGNEIPLVKSITVIGKLTTIDLYVFEEMFWELPLDAIPSVIDLGQTTGYTSIPEEAFCGESLPQKIILPACVQLIEEEAFWSEEANTLEELVLYALVPPTVSEYAFLCWDEEIGDYVLPNMIVKVPASAVPLYQAHEFWSQFPIYAIDAANTATLTVQLPQNADNAKYKNMYLEVKNMQNEQVRKFVITDRTSYSFDNLFRGTTYEVSVRNAQGRNLGTETILLKEGQDSVSLVFNHLLQPVDLSIQILKPSGEDVTSQLSIQWLNTQGDVIHKGETLPKQVENDIISYQILLNEALGIEYQQPHAKIYTVNPEQPLIVDTLSLLPRYTISGKVINTYTGFTIRNANVGILQTINKEYVKSFTTTTNDEGIFSATMVQAPTTLTVEANGYVTAQQTHNLLADTSFIVQLNPFAGTTILLDIDYTPISYNASTTEPQKGYIIPQNIHYSLYNQSTQKQIHQLEISGTLITTNDTINIGDSLVMTIQSHTNDFAPVVIGTRKQDNTPIKLHCSLIERGGIRATYIHAPLQEAVAILYDSVGQFVQRNLYDDVQQVSFSHLPEGSYTLVSMQQNTLYTHLPNLSAFQEMLLTESVDYIATPITVNDALCTQIKIDSIPAINLEKLSYVLDKTTFTANKASLLSGTYLTLRASIGIKAHILPELSDFQLVVELPENATMVENAVMLNSSIAAYSVQGNKIIIPMTNPNDLVRFCIIPMQAQEYIVNAYLRFLHNDQEVLQPIGAAYFQAENASIEATLNIVDKTVNVHGITTPHLLITIYDNDIQIGQTKSQSNGEWKTTCKLDKPYNLSKHNIYAQIQQPNGLVVSTQTKQLTYNQSTTRVLSVAMTHFNWELDENMDVVWDFVKGTVNNRSYNFADNDFTFRIDFSNNSPEIIKSVILHVHTDKHNTYKITAQYNAENDCWTAKQYFNMSTTGGPINVSVEYIANDEEYLVDNDLLNEIHDLLNTDSLFAPTPEDTLIMQLEEAIALKQLDRADSLIYLLCPDVVIDKDDITPVDVDLLIAQHDSLKNDSLYNFDFYLLEYEMAMDSIAQWTKGITISDCSTIDTTHLKQQGYELYETTSNSVVYVLATDEMWHFVDYNANISYYVDLTANGEVAKQLRQLQKVCNGSDGSSLSTVQQAIVTINNIREGILNSIRKIQDIADKIRRFIFGDKAELAKETSSDIKDYVGLIDETTGNIDDALSNQNTRLLHQNANISKWEKTTNPNDGPRKVLTDIRVENQGKIKRNLQWKRQMKYKGSKFLKPLLKIASVCDLATTATSMIDDLNGCIDLWYAAENKKIVEDCPEAKTELSSLQNNIEILGKNAAAFYVMKITIASANVASVIYGLTAAIPSAGMTLGLAVVSAGIILADIAITNTYQGHYEESMSIEKNKLNNIHCKPEEDDDENDDDNDEDKNPQPPIIAESPTPATSPIYDPAGYVYEAVSDNRVENVKATIYYKQYTENALGEIIEQDVLWDAENYGQENPLYTNEQGMYRWDVPQGLWQVRFEKEGYESTQSDWLPVPPPQLEVNIPIVQLTQPEVQHVEAFATAIDIAFNKYMQPALLNVENIYVVANDQVIEGSIIFKNELVSYEGEDSTYVSQLRFIPNSPFTAEQITLTISNRVRSYAGINMAETYQQTFDVVGLTPLLQADAPTASIVSGSTVKLGTELHLASTTPNAQIRYTFDGSDPTCDRGFVYNGEPIILTDYKSHIRAITCAEGYDPSEISDFTYVIDLTTSLETNSSNTAKITKILRDNQILILREGKTYTIMGAEIK